MITALTGHFKGMLTFTFLIFIHELGHTLCAFCFRWKIEKIYIYPYGGCSVFEQEMNVALWQEFLVLIMGPLFQIIFVFLLSFILDTRDLELYERYSFYILLFNLLPIYPLDGGKFLFLICNLFISYYHSFQVILYFSYFAFFLCFFLCLFFMRNLVLVFIFLLLFQKIWREIQLAPYYYHRFLLERYLYFYSFSRNKIISHDFQMMRGVNHFFQKSNQLYTEKQYLKMRLGKKTTTYIRL